MQSRQGSRCVKLVSRKWDETIVLITIFVPPSCLMAEFHSQNCGQSYICRIGHSDRLPNSEMAETVEMSAVNTRNGESRVDSRR